DGTAAGLFDRVCGLLGAGDVQVANRYLRALLGQPVGRPRAETPLRPTGNENNAVSESPQGSSFLNAIDRHTPARVTCRAFRMCGTHAGACGNIASRAPSAVDEPLRIEVVELARVAISELIEGGAFQVSEPVVHDRARVRPGGLAVRIVVRPHQV